MIKESIILRLSFLFIIVLAVLTAVAAPQDTDSQADAAYQQKNWPEAARLYSILAQNENGNGLYFYRLGVAEQSQGHYEAALAAFNQAKSKGTPAQIVDYNLACVYARMNRHEEAITQLQDALAKGFSQPDQLATDPDLESLRSDAKFSQIVQQAKRNQEPCEYNADNRQFDFWIGDWRVSRTSGGPQVGTSHIEKAIGGCVIWENWTSLGSSYFGKSYNAFNQNLKRWEQFWVDNQGGMIHFFGGLKDGTMDFYTDDVPQPDGSKLRRHLQFLNLGPDKVRQFSQGSTDGGKTWNVEYDFTYIRGK